MNCNRFRFLIQQRFDTEISPQDDRALLMHLETCDSCQKFHHQVQQVILAAEELSIPQELQPQGLDQLANKIKEQIPVSKTKLLDAAVGFVDSLKKIGKGKKGVADPSKSKSVTESDEFPIPNFGAIKRKRDQEILENKIAQVKIPETKIVAGAFKPNQEPPPEAAPDRSGQSNTKSLGEKFGRAPGLQNETGSLHGRNLAESILKLNKTTDLQRQTFEKLGSDSPTVQSEAPGLATESQQSRLSQVDSQSGSQMPTRPTPVPFNFSVGLSAQGPASQDASSVIANPWNIDNQAAFNSSAPPSAAPTSSAPGNPVPFAPPAFAANPPAAPAFVPSPANSPAMTSGDSDQALRTFSIPPSVSVRNITDPQIISGPAAAIEPPLRNIDSQPSLPTFPASPSLQNPTQSRTNLPASVPTPSSPTPSMDTRAPERPSLSTPLTPTPAPFNKAAESWGKSWGSDVPKGSTPDSEWGPPPKGGVWEEPIDPTPSQQPLKISNYSEGEATLVEGNRVPALSLDSLTEQSQTSPPPPPSPKLQNSGNHSRFVSAWQEPTSIQNWSPSPYFDSTVPTSTPQSPAERNYLVKPASANQQGTAMQSFVPVSPPSPLQSVFGPEPLAAAQAAPPVQSAPPAQSTFPSQSVPSQPAPSVQPTAAFQPSPPVQPVAENDKNAVNTATSDLSQPKRASIPQRPSWSPDAEQIETGTWQALAFNNDNLRATAAGPASGQRLELGHLAAPRPTAPSKNSAQTPNLPLTSPPNQSPATSSRSRDNLSQQSSSNPPLSAQEKNTVLLPTTPEQESSLTIQEKLDKFRAMEFAKNDSQVLVDQITKVESTEARSVADNAPAKKSKSNNTANRQEQLQPKQESPADLSPKISPVVSKKADLMKENVAPIKFGAETDSSKPDMNNRQSSTSLPKLTSIPTPPLPQQSSAQQISPFDANSEGKGIETGAKDNNNAAPAKPPAAAAESENSGLFNLDDSAIDKLFSENLGVTERSLPANPRSSRNKIIPPPEPKQTSQEPRSSIIDSSGNQSIFEGLPQDELQPLSAKSNLKMPTNAARPAADLQSGKLFSIDDNMIDDIFSEQLGVTDKALDRTARPSDVIETTSSTASGGNASPLKVEGIGRLDNRSDTTSDTAGAGKISAIGKFLLDGPDLEKIGKLAFADPAETKMRILTKEAATELKALLQQIDSQPDVVGSIILGHDQFLIAHTMPAEMDAESLGQLAYSVYMNTVNIANKMGYDMVHQLVSKTQKGYLIVADFGDGLLVTASDAQDVEKIAPLLNNINQLAIS